MKKAYVIDTNIFLSDPGALYNFKNNDIIIPFPVLEELDKKKSIHENIVGINARHIIRELEALREKGNLCDGVKLGKGLGTLYVKNIDGAIPIPQELSNSPDDRIIAIAFIEKQKNKDKKIVVVSRDINVRIKADSLQIKAENYEVDKTVDKKDQLYSGSKQILIDDQIIDRFYNGENIFLEKENFKTLYPNQFILMVSSSNDKKSALAKFVNYNTPLKRVNEYKNGIWNIKAKNKEQLCLFNLLMNPDLALVSVNGLAGSGKSLLSLAAGLEQTLGSNKLYKRLIVIRPIVSVGKEMGFLPGSAKEKMEPWLAAIVDNLRFLFNNDTAKLDDYLDDNIIEIEAMTFIRGRSISDAFIIVDESQQLSAHELKTIITRCGVNTKIVLNGDIMQIDNAYLNEINCGLSYVAERFKNQEIAGHITLTKGERSLLATIASKIL